MQAVTMEQVRAAMANGSKGDAKRMNPPPDLEALDFDALEFLGWRDPKAPQRAYLVTWQGDQLVGLVLRTPERVTGRPVMCDLCRTTHSGGGVALLVAPRPGARGRDGDTVGTYVCADLQCSSHVRRTAATAEVRPAPGTTPEQRAAELASRVDAFATRVLDV